MITRYRVQNYKNLIDVQIEPQAVNAVIGPNGSGKSSLLQSVDFLRAFFMSSVEVYLQEKGWDYRDLPNLRQARKSIEWQLEATLDADARGHGGGVYEYAVRLTPRRYLGISREQLIYTAPDAEPLTLLKRETRRAEILNRRTGEREQESYRVPASIMSTLDPARDRDRYPEMLRFREWVEGFRYFLIWDPKVLRSPDRGRHQELGPSGEHLAPLLALLRQSHPDRYQRLLKRIQRLFPHVADLSVGGRGWGWRTLRLHEREDGREVPFNSRQASDGVLRLLAVASLLYVDHPPTVAMLEEPEDGVHPQLLKEAVQILRELTLRKPPHRCQVLFTTHSPYVLDEFYDHPEQVFVMERARRGGGVSAVQLSTIKQIEQIKETFSGSLGEAWFSGLIGGAARGRGR